MSSLVVFIIFFIMTSTSADAAWQVPREVINGEWGSGDGMFGLLAEDTSDSFPDLVAVLPSGEIVIDDSVNDHVLIYGEDGEKIKEVHWALIKEPKGEDYYQLPEYGISEIRRYDSKGNYWTDSVGGANKYNSQNKLIATYEKNSLAIGVESKKRNPTEDTYTRSIQYEDVTYVVTTPGSFDNPVRDANGFLYGTASPQGVNYPWYYRVYKFDQCGKLIGTLDFPENIFVDHEEVAGEGAYGWTEVVEEYGPPVIGHDGSVHCWKRTPDTYSIIKWAWMDEPGDPKSDCSK